MTVLHGETNHKAIFWDTHDLGKTVELSVIDYGNPQKSVHKILILDSYDMRLMISELSKLLVDMEER